MHCLDLHLSQKLIKYTKNKYILRFVKNIKLHLLRRQKTSLSAKGIAQYRNYYLWIPKIMQVQVQDLGSVLAGYDYCETEIRRCIAIGKDAFQKQRKK